MTRQTNAQRTWSDTIGRWFASKGEKVRGEQLWLLQMHGLIDSLSFQFKFVLGKEPHQCRFFVDFHYWDREKKQWVHEDFKGRMWRDWDVKRKWLWAQEGIDVVLIRAEDL